jgi:hypothetical protein
VYFWIFPAACGLVAIVVSVANLPAILRQKREMEKRFERLKSYPALFDVNRARRSIDRIDSDLRALPALISRSQAALTTLRGALRELRMRRARTAVALTSLSIRALAASLRARA